MDEVGTLLFAEYPSTVVFTDYTGRPIIREWVDCSADGKVDRFFFFKTNSNNLSLFIKGLISHRHFVNIAEGDLYYFEDVKSIDETVVERTLLIGSLPAKYYPGKIYIIESDIIDLVQIVEKFNLFDLQDSFDSTVKKLAQQEGFDTYNLHLEGLGVGHGIVKTELLGKSLIAFDNLYQEATFDRVLGTTRGDVSKKIRHELEAQSSTEIYHSMAASYSVLIKPKYTFQYADINEEPTSSSSETARKVFNLINSSLTHDLLNKTVASYSPRLIEAFRSFAQHIKDNHLTISLSWYSPSSQIMHEEKIDSDKAGLIINNIKSLDAVTEEPLTKKGKFDLLNCTTGHFGFNAEGNEAFTGYFDAAIKEGIRLVNFVDVYTVSIIKTTTRIAGKTEPKIEHKLTAYYREAQ